MTFRHGQDGLFSTDELLAGFMLVLDEITARRAVYAWLDSFGHYVRGTQVLQPCGGWDDYGLPGGYADYEATDANEAPAETFRSSQPDDRLMHVIPDAVRLLLVRYSELHLILIALASRDAYERFRRAGLVLSWFPSTDEEKSGFFSTVRTQLLKEY